MISTLAPLPRAGSSTSRTDERRFVLDGVPWSAYVALRDALDDHSGLRLTYLEGTLELMSPSIDHEDYKTLIARLLEAYAEERDLDLRGFGGTTFRKEAKQRGLEPDECYTLGKMRDVPDVAIEIVVTAPLVDKLDVYHGLGVPEVWVWQDRRLVVLLRADSGYAESPRSALLAELDLTLLASFVATDVNQTERVKAFRKALRGANEG